MKNEKEIKVKKTTTQQLRDIRDKINEEIKDLSVEQLKAYFKETPSFRSDIMQNK